MATEAVAIPRAGRPLSLDRIVPKLLIAAFLLGLGYLTLAPLIRLEWLSFKGGEKYS